MLGPSISVKKDYVCFAISSAVLMTLSCTWPPSPPCRHPPPRPSWSVPHICLRLSHPFPLSKRRGWTTHTIWEIVLLSLLSTYSLIGVWKTRETCLFRNDEKGEEGLLSSILETALVAAGTVINPSSSFFKDFHHLQITDTLIRNVYLLQAAPLGLPRHCSMFFRPAKQRESSILSNQGLGRYWCILRSINVCVIPNLIRSIHVKLCVWLPTFAIPSPKLGPILFHFFDGSPSPTRIFPAISTFKATAAILKEN